MVKFVGGPSVNAYKNYRNHRIAREGQFRMPRNYGRVTNKTTIIVRNNTQCHCSKNSSNNFLGILMMLPDLFNSLGKLFTPKQPVKNDPVTTETVVEPETVVTEEPVTPEPEPIVNTELSSTVKEKTVDAKEAEKLTTTIKDADMYTIRNQNKDRTVTKNGQSVTQKAYNAPLWQTLGKSYTTTINGKTEQLKITPEFQKYFIDTYLNGDEAKVWDLGKDQEFITKLTWKDQTYTFNAETFKNKENWDLYWVDENGKNQVGTTQAKYSEADAGKKVKTTTWTGTTTFKFDANNDGDYTDKEDINKTWTATSTTSADDVKKQIKDKIEKSNLSDAHKQTAFGNLTNTKITKSN